MIINMGRGINLGNTLSAPIEGNWAPPVEQSYFQDIAALGFKTVRIPIRFDNQTTALSSVTYEDTSGNYIGSVTRTVKGELLFYKYCVAGWLISVVGVVCR